MGDTSQRWSCVWTQDAIMARVEMKCDTVREDKTLFFSRPFSPVFFCFYDRVCVALCYAMLCFAVLFCVVFRSGGYGHALEDQPGDPDANNGANEEGYDVSAALSTCLPLVHAICCWCWCWWCLVFGVDVIVADVANFADAVGCVSVLPCFSSPFVSFCTCTSVRSRYRRIWCIFFSST